MTVAALSAHIHTHFLVSLSVLDELKIDYSHTDTRTVAAPYFFQHCDAAGHTTLWCHKYNKDDKMQCMTASLIRGVVAGAWSTWASMRWALALMIVEEGRHDIVALCGVARPGHAGDCEGRGGTRSCLTGRVADRCGAAGARDGLPVLRGPDDPEACAGGSEESE
ncbi:hypothetical protein TcBrA4_0024720 [Trypanosoma cruzi]|nr:hypothetical protein TcBrA4_0024720 [Trypanosoma cruzi]